ncbi:hypothetical protein SERLA73DRAFT_109097 [Serpula lacrymans var. lacrymans S7.3]|uniref:Carboxylic ester hydrolase n=2 Tax=Serpula lacrymans var. lacrymans TaxID=341189 RepID=F8Q0N1_SERL3|nr:uncharacterized protein SERLADRAFT_361845 [Serpula lacrymans var. lacrymans S7.9]EGN97860.1 hypothetical protein SERLA73DRAFT_109097 [Serpula lacrymans var. lacrymans S7.3]EGO23442.1 hypothetical protein SERLADRAFT_361845 [Serpula lacrymans var. lacrymans S7.9]
MIIQTALTSALLFTIGTVATGPLSERAPPLVQLDNATFTGVNSGNVSKFLGIPFAQAPVGNLRFQLPQPHPSYVGDHAASEYSIACPQQAIRIPAMKGVPAYAVDSVVQSFGDLASPAGEDCLYINVIAPANVTSMSKLPVVLWIFGGGFQGGSASSANGSVIVERSLELNEPVIYVSMNHRLVSFGFLASQEVKDAGVGNLGLQDQREAMRWVQKYISSFGGDPTKVTLWGQSSGAISVSLQMLTNGGDTEGLFRAAYMQSGSPIPVGDITKGQTYYDFLVDQTGCSGALDTLQCLREVPYDILKSAVDRTPNIFSYQSLVLAWVPRADGNFLMDDPQKLVQQGSVANIPIISGDCDDEATMFSFSTLNITTNDQVYEYIKSYFLPNAPSENVTTLLEMYPQNVTEGSPFNTGYLNVITPQFKRLAALQGDGTFQGPRRFFLQQRSGKQNMWSFLSKRFKATPFLGAFHGSDLFNVFGPGDMTDYLVRFVANLDPNGNTSIYWPQYTTQSPNLLTFRGGLTRLNITQDTYRKEAMDYITNLFLQYPM